MCCFYFHAVPRNQNYSEPCFDFLTDDYELIGNTPETPMALHGCVGIRNSQNQILFYFINKKFKNFEFENMQPNCFWFYKHFSWFCGPGASIACFGFNGCVFKSYSYLFFFIGKMMEIWTQDHGIQSLLCLHLDHRDIFLQAKNFFIQFYMVGDVKTPS